MSDSFEVIDDIAKNQVDFKNFNYPITFSFRIGTLSNDFIARDSKGIAIAYVRQKMFKLKEDVQVFSDETKSNQIYRIAADRIIDFNAVYSFFNNNEVKLGKVGRKGRKSILKAHYNIFDENDNNDYIIEEENPWAKFWDALLSEVPLLGILTGYFFNPRYAIKNIDGKVIAKLTKERSFFGRTFRLDEIGEFEPGDDERVMLSTMMMTLLERRRG
jgi:hypothetical protein